jgi:hypothetical protein
MLALATPASAIPALALPAFTILEVHHWHFRRFRVDLGTDFSGFSRLHRASDSTRSVKGRTSVFAGRRSTFKGSQTLQKERKSTKIHNQLLRRCFANAQHEENSIFPLSDATWRRF